MTSENKGVILGRPAPSKSWEELGLNPNNNPFLDREEKIDKLLAEWDSKGKNTKDEFLATWVRTLDIPGIEDYIGEIYDGLVKAFWQTLTERGTLYLMNIGAFNLTLRRTTVSEHHHLQRRRSRCPALVKDGIYYKPPFFTARFKSATVGKIELAKLAGDTQRKQYWEKEATHVETFASGPSQETIWLRRMRALLKRKKETGETIAWILRYGNNKVIGTDFYTYEDSATARKEGYVARHESVESTE